MDTAKEQAQPAKSYRISGVKFLGDNWISGKVGSLRFQAKVYAEASKFGINSGNVSKLTV